MRMMKYDRPHSNNHLGLEFKTFDHWLIEHVRTNHNHQMKPNGEVKREEPKGEIWKNMFCSMIDYLANPAIGKKNS